MSERSKVQMTEERPNDSVALDIIDGASKEMNVIPYADENGDQVKVNTELLKSMKKNIGIEPSIIKASAASISCSIHRVPHRLRRDNEIAYIPQIISIGPLHYNRRSIGPNDKEDKKWSKEQAEGRNKWRYAMEEHKWRYMRDILAWKEEDCLEHFLKNIMKREKQARQCYSEEIHLDTDSFAEMMVLDGCFIIELFRRAKEDKDDPLVKLEWLRKQLSIDLLKLENQIPFFILQLLCRLMSVSFSCFAEMALEFFSVMLPTTEYCKNPQTHGIQHLLHLVHSSLLSVGDEKKKRNIENQKQSPSKETPRKPGTMEMTPCASELRAVGFVFKKRESRPPKEETGSFLDIKFLRQSRKLILPQNVIEIPPVTVSDATGIVFLNLVSFEQCYRYCPTDFSAYLVLMDSLIATAKDVAILCDNGIENCLGSYQQVTDFVNKIGGKLFIDDNKLQETIKDINEHYRETTKHMFRSSLKRNFIKNPSAVISTCIGFVSVFTIISFQLYHLIRSLK